MLIFAWGYPQCQKYRDLAVARAESAFDHQLLDVIKTFATKRAS
jgi:hypothetical protein